MLLFGIIGSPVSHSKSPLIHNAWLKENNIMGAYQYIPVENQENLAEVLNILPKIGYAGVNITVPYKHIAFEITKALGFQISDDAETLGAINTINFKEKTALNTDTYGFSKIFKPHEEDHILIIGAGGVASSVILACEGANITITNRTPEKAENIAEKFMCDTYKGELSKLDLSNFDAIINATSFGMKNEVLPLNYKTIQKNTTCIDTIYNPVITPFLSSAKEKGCKIINGTMMLINQGAKSFENWTGIIPNIQTAQKLLKEFIIT